MKNSDVTEQKKIFFAERPWGFLSIRSFSQECSNDKDEPVDLRKIFISTVQLCHVSEITWACWVILLFPSLLFPSFHWKSHFLSSKIKSCGLLQKMLYVFWQKWRIWFTKNTPCVSRSPGIRFLNFVIVAFDRQEKMGEKKENGYVKRRKEKRGWKAT